MWTAALNSSGGACVFPPFTSRWMRRTIEAAFAALTSAIVAIERRRRFAYSVCVGQWRLRASQPLGARRRE
jgi:hypothetical protein